MVLQPLHPYCRLHRRSGCFPAWPYPPGSQYQNNAGPIVVARKKVTPP